MIRTKTKFVAIVGAALMAAPALANSPVISVAGGTPAGLANGPYTLGFTFSVDRDFFVTGFGVYDANGDGLQQSHEVGLYSSAGALLGSTTLAAGTGGTLIGGFRFTSVAPLRIGVGTYRVGAVFSGTSGDQLFFPAGTPGLTATTVTSATGVTYLGSAFGDQSNTLSFPNNDNGTGGYIGPNLLVASVPEPATWGLMILGLGAMGAAVRRGRTVRTRVAFG